MLLPASTSSSTISTAPIPTYALAAKTKARASGRGTSMNLCESNNTEKIVPKPENPYETVTVDSSGMVATIPKTVQELESKNAKNEGKQPTFGFWSEIQNYFDLIAGIETSLSPEPVLNKDSAFRATFFGIGPGDLKIPMENKGGFASQLVNCC